MKDLYLNRIAGVTLVALIALPASANFSSGKVVQDVYSAIGSGGQVNVTVDDGVATLTGYASNDSLATKAANAALSHSEVNTVINLISAQ